MESIELACAPNLSGIIDEIIKAYLKTEATVFNVTIGENCSVYYREILNHKHYDIFLSADETSAKKLFDLGFAKRINTYAEGKLCIWPISDIDFSYFCKSKISIPDPQIAPYGRAAFEYLKNENIFDFVKNNLIFGKNPFEVSQNVLAKKADIAFLPLSFVKSVLKSDTFLMLKRGYKPIIQTAAILAQSTKYAYKFFDWLIDSRDSRRIFEIYGL